MWPSMPCTTSWSRQTAGDDAIFPFAVSCLQTTAPSRLLGDRLRLRRLERAVPLLENHLREEARHHAPFAEVAEPLLRLLAVREREGELRVTRAGSRRQREAAAEARVHVRH